MTYTFKASPKDSTAVADMSINWATNFLVTDETIASFDVTCPDESIVISQKTQAAGVTRWRVSGGVTGTNPIITCEIVTSAGRREPNSIMLPIRDQ